MRVENHGTHDRARVRPAPRQWGNCALDSGVRWWEALLMSHAAKSVLDAFELLPPAEREQVVLELLRRTAMAPHDSPDDAALLRAADDIFLGLDRQEA